jgi:hypothetical protein
LQFLKRWRLEDCSSKTNYEKLARPYLRNKLGVMLCTCGSSYLAGKGGRITASGQPGQKLTPGHISEITLKTSKKD